MGSFVTNKPSASKHKFVFVSELEGQNFKIIATAACEVSSVTVTAGGSAAVFRLVDANNFIQGQPAPSYNLESGPSYAVESSNSFSPNLTRPIPFTKGLVIVCEQGEGSNAEISLTVD